MARSRQLDFDDAVDYLMERVGERVAVSWPDEVTGEAGWRNTLIGQLDPDDGEDSPYAFRLDGTAVYYGFTVDPADFEAAALDSRGLTLDLGWRVFQIRDALHEGDPRIIEATTERQVRLPNGKTVPVRLHEPAEAAIKGINVVADAGRPNSWELIYELRNLARESAEFKVEFLPRARSTPLQLATGYTSLDAGRRQPGSLLFRPTPNATRCDLFVTRQR